MSRIFLTLRQLTFLFVVLSGVAADALRADEPAKTTAPVSTKPAAAPADEISPPKFLGAWGTKGPNDGEFNAPIGIAINAADDVFITDAHKKNVQRFSRDGKFLDKYETGSFSGGIAIDKEGLIYVSVMMEYKIRVLRHKPADAADEKPDAAPYELIREWGKQGIGDGEFDQPGGLVFGPDGTLYVCDQVNHRVQRFTKEGKFLAKWGEYGDANGQFGKPEKPYSRVGGPCFIGVDRDGNLYTTEPRPGRIQKFSPDGKWLAGWGSNEVRNGAFGGGKNLPGPIAILFDRENRAWVSSTNHRAQLFTPDGRYLTGLGTTAEPSDAPGQFHTPHMMAINSQNVLYVVDTQNYRVQMFALPRE